MLKPDSVDILNSILQELRQPGSPTKPFIVPNYAIRVNCFLIIGLFVSILVAMVSILVKQWMRSYQSDLSGISSPHLRARIRHFRYNGAKRWHLSSIVGFLSVLMHFSMFISAVAIIDLLLTISPIVGRVTLSLFAVGTPLFVTTILLPLFALDAPFRTPFSDSVIRALRFMKGRVHLSRAFKRSHGANNIETSLEDQVGIYEMGVCEASDLVCTRIDLDFEILCHLLKIANKATERWLLDKCFEKLPKLERQDPEMILQREIILEVYIFLAKGCITTQGSKKEINPDRLLRARLLCNFIAWFLSLPRTTPTRLQLQQRLKRSFDPMELPRALVGDTSVASIHLALTAQARIEHLIEQESGDGQCTVCAKATDNLLNAQYPDQRKQVITSFILTHSDCILFHAKSSTGAPAASERTSMCAGSLRDLNSMFQGMSPVSQKEKTEWVKSVKQRSEKTKDATLRSSWFDELLKIVERVETVSNSARRKPSPVPNPGLSGSAGIGAGLPEFPGGRNSAFAFGSQPGSPSSLRTESGRGISSGSDIKITINLPSQSDLSVPIADHPAPSLPPAFPPPHDGPLGQ
ncbi:hypothetical protein FRC17_009912 [Serendipita sp. 399]|nr:hypothetical protein FRC17_009912 [Serendipita sp. 399]